MEEDIEREREWKKGTTTQDESEETEMWTPDTDNKTEHEQNVIMRTSISTLIHPHPSMRHLGDRSIKKEIDGQDGIIARDRNSKEDIEAFKRATEMWQRAGEIAKRMMADIRRKEHMVAGDCKSKNNKKRESKDEELLKKYWKRAEKR